MCHRLVPVAPLDACPAQGSGHEALIRYGQGPDVCRHREQEARPMPRRIITALMGRFACSRSAGAASRPP